MTKVYACCLQLILNSMHKYQPRVHLVKRKEGTCSNIVDLDNEEYKTFIFPETIFTAVTAYQNQLVSEVCLYWFELLACLLTGKMDMLIL